MITLEEILARLRAHEAELKARGILHAAVFGSVARGEARPDSDVDIMVELDPAARIGVFRIVELKDELSHILGRPVDLVTRKGLHPDLKDRILASAVDVY